MGVIHNWLDATRVVRSALSKLVLFFGVVMSGFSGIAPAHADGYVQSDTVWRSNISPVVDFPADRAGDACSYFAQTAFSKTSYVSFDGVGKCWVLPPPNSNLLKGTYWATTDPDRDSVEMGEYLMARTATVCPEHSNFTYSGCWCWSGYVPDGKSCVLAAACPDHASRLSPDMPCICDTDYEFDTTGTSCVRKCTIDPLPEPPFKGDTDPACTASLEKGRGQDIDHKCRELTEEMKDEAQCLADKIRALAIPYSGPSATVRTTAYQQHLLDVWKGKNDITKKQKYMSDGEKQACATIIADIEAHVDHHKIKAKPSEKGDDAPHVLGQAIDIPSAVTDAMIAKIAETTFFLDVQTYPIANCLACIPIPMDFNDVQDYVNSSNFNPPACNLRWGGTFDPYDPVHFQLPKQGDTTP